MTRTTIIVFLIAIAGWTELPADTRSRAFRVSETNSARDIWKVVLWDLGHTIQGETVHVTTCPEVLPGASHVGDTFIRLKYATTELDWRDLNDNRCGTGGRGSSVVFSAPYERDHLYVYLGCFANTACSGTAVARRERNANGILIDPESAFNALPSMTATDRRSKLYFMNDMFPNSYHWFTGGTTWDHAQSILRLPDWVSPGNHFLIFYSDEDRGGGATLLHHGAYKVPNSDSFAKYSPHLSPLVSTSNFQNGAENGIAALDPYHFDHPGGAQRSGRYAFTVLEDADGATEWHMYMYGIDGGGGRNVVTAKWAYAGADKGGSQGGAITKLQGASYLADTAYPTGLARRFLLLSHKNRTLFFYTIEPDAYGWTDIGSRARVSEWHFWRAEPGHNLFRKRGTTPWMPFVDNGGSGYEAINLLTDQNGHLWAVGMFSHAFEYDVIDLYRLYFPGEEMPDQGQTCRAKDSRGRGTCLEKRSSRVTRSGGSAAEGAGKNSGSSFDGASGVYVTPDGRTIMIYSCEWGDDDDGDLRVYEWAPAGH